MTIALRRPAGRPGRNKIRTEGNVTGELFPRQALSPRPRPEGLPAGTRLEPLLSALAAALLLAAFLAGSAIAEEPRGRDLRERLIQADSVFAFSADVHLSPEEKDADAVLNALRASYLKRFAAQPDLPFRTPFASSRQEIRETGLHRALRAMPKGGMLHIHATATGRVEWIVDRALSMPECQIFWEETNETNVHGQLGVFPAGPAPKGWILLSGLKARRPDLRRELVELYTLGPEELGVPDVWKEFEAIFWRIDGFVSYRPVFLAYYLDAFETLARDGVQFLELRTSLDPVQAEDGTLVESRGVVEMYRSILDRVRKSHPGFDLAIIVCGSRGADASEVRGKMDLERRLAAEYPDLVVGFDLVGEEDRGRTTEYYAAALGSRPPVPLYLHGGESLSASNYNVLDAWLLGAQRIGHGVNLVNFLHLERKVRETGTVLEICPISNQALGYVPDLRLHPARGLLMRGVQGVLSSDDPGIFRSEGLTDEFWQAYVAWGLDLRDLKQLARNSIVHSGLSPARRHRHLESFDARWRRFIRSVTETWPREAP